MAFSNLDAIRTTTPNSHITLKPGKSGYLGRQIIVPDLPFNISRMQASHWWHFLFLLAGFSFVVGFLAYRLRHHTRLIIIPIAMYFLSTILFTVFRPAAMGTILTAAAYTAVYYAARGVREFTPHWDLKDKGLLNEARRSALSTMFFQYTVTSLGAIGIIALACLFKSAPLVRSALGAIGTSGADSAVIRAVEVPFVLATTFYGTFGCVAVALFITRELHIKSHELMVMPDSLQIAVTSSDLALKQKEQ